jgi:hypothetical protein
MTVGWLKCYTGHTAGVELSQKSPWPNPTNIRRGGRSPLCFAVACCPLPVDHSRPPPSPPSPPSPLAAAAAPAASFAAVAVAVAVVGLAPPQPPPPAFLGNPRGRSPLGDPPPPRTVSPQAEPYNGFAVAPSPQPLQPPNRRGSSPSTIQMLAAGNAHNKETPAAAFPFS